MIPSKIKIFVTMLLCMMSTFVAQANVSVTMKYVGASARVPVMFYFLERDGTCI